MEGLPRELVWDVVGRLPVRDVLLGVAPLSRYFHTLLCGATPSWTSDEFWRLYALRWHLVEPLNEMPTCWRTFCRAGEHPARPPPHTLSLLSAHKPRTGVLALRERHDSTRRRVCTGGCSAGVRDRRRRGGGSGRPQETGARQAKADGCAGDALAQLEGHHSAGGLSHHPEQGFVLVPAGSCELGLNWWLVLAPSLYQVSGGPTGRLLDGRRGKSSFSGAAVRDSEPTWLTTRPSSYADQQWLLHGLSQKWAEYSLHGDVGPSPVLQHQWRSPRSFLRPTGTCVR